MFNLDDYVEKLCQNQNIGADPDQKDLYTKEDFYKMMRPVFEVLKEHPDYSMEELRTCLFERSGVIEKAKDFIYRKEMIPGVVCGYGTGNYREVIVLGNRQEVTLDANGQIVPNVKQMTEDTIFDLASVTKIFTSLSMLQLISSGVIDSLEDKVTKYSPRFKNLGNVTLYQLLSFNVPLSTTRRVDSATSRLEAEEILEDIFVDENNKSLYTDMGAMVLKYVIEDATGMNYYDYLYANILSKLGMNDTHVNIPKHKLDRLASTSFDGKVMQDGRVVINSNMPGEVYDPKARVMAQSSGNLSGHAGLFSTVHDMNALARGLIDAKILDPKYIEMMAKNRTGKTIDGRNVQYFGFLCYAKNPVEINSEVFRGLSARAFASAGWTGNQLSVDPINDVFLFMSGNRSHNRITYVNKDQEDMVRVDQTTGKKYIEMPDGLIKIDSRRYAYDKDQILRPCIILAMQYKALEDILGYDIKEEKTIQIK